jgi:hypothetical protein
MESKEDLRKDAKDVQYRDILDQVIANKPSAKKEDLRKDAKDVQYRDTLDQVIADRPSAKKRNPFYVPKTSPDAAQTGRKIFTIKKFADVPMSVKKLEVVARLVRRLHVHDAIIQLMYYSQKKAARLILQVCILFTRGPLNIEMLSQKFGGPTPSKTGLHT